MQKRGFTLVEVMLSIGLMSIILLPLFSLLITNTRNYNNITKRNELQERATQIMYGFRNTCLYTRDVGSFLLSGSNSMDKVFDPGEGYIADDDGDDGETTNGLPFELELRQPSSTAAGGYKNTKYTYVLEKPRTEGLFLDTNRTMHNVFTISDDNGTVLELEDVIVSVQPVVKITDDTTTDSYTFNNATGISVTVELVNPKDHKYKNDVRLKLLTNTFYFRNSDKAADGVLSKTPTPDDMIGVPLPEGMEISTIDTVTSTPTEVVPTVTPDVTTFEDPNPSPTSTPGTSSSSTPGTSSSATPGTSSSATPGASTTPGTSSSPSATPVKTPPPTPIKTPTPTPVKTPTPTPVPTPTPTPVKTPTPAPTVPPTETTPIGLGFDYIFDGNQWWQHYSPYLASNKFDNPVVYISGNDGMGWPLQSYNTASYFAQGTTSAYGSSVTRWKTATFNITEGNIDSAASGTVFTFQINGDQDWNKFADGASLTFYNQIRGRSGINMVFQNNSNAAVTVIDASGTHTVAQGSSYTSKCG